MPKYTACTFEITEYILETSSAGYKSSSSAWYMETIEDANITFQVQSTTEGYVSEKSDIEQGMVVQISL